MKRMFKRREHNMPELNTSSLPDLIFTVLFFFMIVTHMRDVDPKVTYRVPQGSEVQKTGHKSAVTYIYIGRCMPGQAQDDLALTDGKKGKFFIQLNDRLATIDDIKAHIEKERASMNSEDQTRMTVSIKADRDVPMGIIADVKKQLQQSMALRINYSATEKE